MKKRKAKRQMILSFKPPILRQTSFVKSPGEMIEYASPSTKPPVYFVKFPLAQRLQISSYCDITFANNKDTKNIGVGNYVYQRPNPSSSKAVHCDPGTCQRAERKLIVQVIKFNFIEQTCKNKD